MKRYLTFILLLHLYFIMAISFVAWKVAYLDHSIECTVGPITAGGGLGVNGWVCYGLPSHENELRVQLFMNDKFVTSETVESAVFDWGFMRLGQTWANHWRFFASYSTVCCTTALLILVITWKTRQPSLPAQDSAFGRIVQKRVSTEMNSVVEVGLTFCAALLRTKRFHPFAKLAFAPSIYRFVVAFFDPQIILLHKSIGRIMGVLIAFAVAQAI